MEGIERPASLDAVRGVMVVKESLTKLEVAKRQLRAAIWLVFHEQNAVAVHTVVAAVHQIVDDLCQHLGEQTVVAIPRLDIEIQGHRHPCT
jgi:hypothetical protein